MNVRPVVVRPPTPDARRLWKLMLSLAGEFGIDREWSLIGGLMVQLHGFENDDDPRATADIDVLGGARRPPRMTEGIAALLVGRGAEIATPPRTNSKLGYRFELEGAIVELLAPDGLRRDPMTVGGLRTFQVPGGTQALRRTEVVLVSLDGEDSIPVRRPNLVGAVLIKARVVTKNREGKYQSDRQDLIRLLGYVDDPRTVGTALSQSEKAWLVMAEGAIDFDDGPLLELFPRETLVRARQSLRLLAQAS